MSKSSELQSERSVESASGYGKKPLSDKAWAGIDKLGGSLNRFSNKTRMRSVVADCTRRRVQQSHSYLGIILYGLWMSGAGGCGVVIARKEDGDWSPPSGIHVQTFGFGFMGGIDIYDCVVVINSREALKAFSKFRFTLGGECSAVVGPLGFGGLLEIEVSKANEPIFTYMKSRGVYCGLQLDTTVIIERNNENARFYGERLTIDEIFAGRVKNIPPEAKMLMEALRRAEGRPLLVFVLSLNEFKIYASILPLHVPKKIDN
ncbi:hypothetical protein B0J13DRAFT_526116 [Dactylonectria estremocensis]|uniref:Ysc84 actin-binding domain-containing protein n=1 Tax=Dactylonectria estremocensis TaxID=1079267 RepID=A0A9P9J048_9HYPO|nr:hypothetical protein B0J13DRAFT_526116 [Dactylonectria estremocensis]